MSFRRTAITLIVLALAQPALRAGDSPGAVDPQAYAHYCWGLMLQERDEWEKALAEFLKAAKLDKESCSIHFEVGNAYNHLKQAKKAMEHLRRAIELDPQHVRARYKLGLLLLTQGSLEEGLAELRVAGNTKEGSGARVPLPRLWNQIAEICTVTKKYDEAIEWYQRVLDAATNSYTEARTLYQIGKIYLSNLHQYEEAVAAFLAARKKFPRFPLTLLLAECYDALERHKEAALEYEAHLAGLTKPEKGDDTVRRSWLRRKAARSWKRAGELVRAEKHWAETAEMVREALSKQKDPDRELCDELLALSREAGKDELKVQALGKLIRISPPAEAITWRVYLSSVWEGLGNDEEAERELLAALKADTGHAEANNNLAYFYAERGKELDKALTFAQRALAADPDNGVYLDSLGWVYYKQGKPQEARAALEKALKNLEKPDPVIYDHLGDVLHKLGNVEGARKYWQSALDGEHPKPDAIKKKLQGSPLTPAE